MTTETAAEMLYDEYTGTTGRFHTSTQKDRWLAFATRVVAAAQPAPAGVIDREAAHRAGGQAYAEGGGPDDVVDAVLAVLPGRTVAQVKAEAWGEAVTEACCESCGCLRAKNVPNPYRADELEREDKR